MVREDILRGIQVAISRGESLEQAMYSFYNAGYSKKDVEEAAQALRTAMAEQQPVIQSLDKTSQISKPIPEKKPIKETPKNQPTAPPQQIQQIQEPKVVQNASSYEQLKPKKKFGPRIIMIIILSIILLILLGSLISIFIFRESLLSFFNNIF